MSNLRFLLMVCALIAFGQQSSSYDVIAKATIDTLNTGYLRWAHMHPAVLHNGAIHINLPSLDLYSKDGKSLYHGDDPGTNVLFIRGLPGDADTAKGAASRPTLKEAVEMVPDLQTRQKELLGGGGYTVFALTYPNWNYCKLQNDAVQDLRRRAQRIGVRVVEVRLQR